MRVLAKPTMYLGRPLTPNEFDELEPKKGLFMLADMWSRAHQQTAPTAVLVDDGLSSPQELPAPLHFARVTHAHCRRIDVRGHEIVDGVEYAQCWQLELA